MAISPIQMFQNNQSSLAQILQGGNQTISGIMDKAVQIGRDLSNNQLQQERDMLAMRQRETALAQRRAENLQQDNEDAIRFARGAFESDRNYGLAVSADQRAGQREARDASMDQARLGIAQSQLGISQGNLDVAKGSLALRQDEYKTEKERAAADAAALANLLKRPEPAAAAPVTQPAAPVEMAGPPNKFSELPATSARPGDYENVNMSLDDRLRARGDVNPAYRKPLAGEPGSPAALLAPPTSATPAAAPTASADQRTQDLAIFGTLDDKLKDKNLPLATRQLAHQKMAEIQAKYPDVNAKPSEARAQARFESQQEKDARKQQESEMKTIVGDTAAFTRQVPQVYSKEGATKKDLEEAKAYDADPFASEYNSAQNYSEEEYVNFKGMKLTPAQKEKRRKLWQYANNKGSSTSSTAAPTGSAWDAVP